MAGSSAGRAGRGGVAAQRRPLAGGERRPGQLEHQPGRGLLLRRLQLLEARAQLHREDVLRPAEELDGLHDAPGEPRGLQRDVHQVARHGHRHPAGLLLHPEGHALARLEHHADELARHERAHRDLRDRDGADDEDPGPRPPLDGPLQERGEQPRQAVHGDEPAPPLERRRGGQQLEVPVHRGEALLVVQHQLVAAPLDGDRPALRIARERRAEAGEHVLERHHLALGARHGDHLAPLGGGQDGDGQAGRPDERRDEDQEAREGASEAVRCHSAVQDLQPRQSKGTARRAARRSSLRSLRRGCRPCRRT